MDRKTLYKQNKRLQETLVKYIDKLALKDLEIADLKRQLERLRNGKDRQFESSWKPKCLK